MRRLVVFICFILVSFAAQQMAHGQCPYSNNYERKVKGIDYNIDLTLDTELKQAVCTQQLKWTNPSPDTIYELQFYMYLNSFRNMESTFLNASKGKVFGRDISARGDHEWGALDITRCQIEGKDHLSNMYFIQPNDGNKNDQSVLEIKLSKPLLPYQSITIDMDYISKLPKIIARAGYSRDNYYLFIHWFPQPGVFEQNQEGDWGWNCHQFMQSTEFYADFGDYNVSITAPEDLIIGGSGCKYAEVNNPDGTKTTKFDARDIIDFAWSAYPYFEEYNDSWKGVEIRMLIPPEHCSMAPRYNGAIKNALDYFEKKIGKYPYPIITLIDPPMHALRSGFMEYPMHITCASFHYMPEGIRTIQGLAIHEFSHMYYMGILASNEKEAAWLDEGFVTYHEDEIIDLYYGGEHASLFDILGYRSGNKEQSRLEYTTMPDPNICAIARPGWEFVEGVYKEIIYAKTGTMLQTLKGLVGADKMDQIMLHYYENNKFTHPREEDFIASVKAIVGDNIKDMPVDFFFRQCLHETISCDYKLQNVQQNSFEVVKEGAMSFPQEVLVTYQDGTNQLLDWSGMDTSKTFTVDKAIAAVYVDPEQKIYLDLNLNNNSYTFNPNKRPIYNYASKAMSWLQNVMLSSSLLF